MSGKCTFLPLKTDHNSMLAMLRKLEKRDGECDGRFVYVSRSQFVEEMGKTNRETAVIYTALIRDRTENFLKGEK